MWEKLASLQGGAECRVRGVLPPEADPGLRPLFLAHPGLDRKGGCWRFSESLKYCLQRDR